MYVNQFNESLFLPFRRSLSCAFRHCKSLKEVMV